MTKISLERLLTGSPSLQDHRQRNCVIRSVTAQHTCSVCCGDSLERGIIRSPREDERRRVYERSSGTRRRYRSTLTDPSDRMVQYDDSDEDTRTLNSIHPADLSETYIYPITLVHLYRRKKIASRNLIKLTILHYGVGQ